MTAETTDFARVVATLQQFAGTNLTDKLSRLEGAIEGTKSSDYTSFLNQNHVDSSALAAAAVMKRLAGQINVTIHALGILLCLPHILKPGEKIEYVSLGAGNTGRAFDLETNKRIAEFKFIHWQGGAETIRQNALFKDFFQLAAADTDKTKYLYVLGTEKPLKFLRGGRAMDSVLSRNAKVHADFVDLYGVRYKRVCDYFHDHDKKVKITDVSPWLPELAGMPDDA